MAKVTQEIALSKKPHDLGEVEPELKLKPPRKKTWSDQDGKKLDENSQQMANQWLAIRGWVVQVKVTEESEGPEYSISLAYKVKGSLYIQSFKIGYDDYHWSAAYGYHYEWFKNTMREQTPLTILVNPDNFEEYCVFGQLEAFEVDPPKKRWLAK